MNAPANLAKSLKLIKVGNSTGVILPKDVLAKLGVEAGDSLDLSDVPGGITITRHDDGFAAQMEAAREVMKRRRNALRELAK
ncbi:transcriptional regulator [Sphingomonas panacis]|uniref:Transcriptional regulator n=2 Tax=Sphingomonas TaxID=13687 RepID=A0A1B3Z870_9SPHN|nr:MULTISPECIES: AbrB/MazE/SpoVT family DNA-binding domain-containing protein [Sphingomonas]AOH83599.1 transcriptional regulator [Sphingomonas panacis]RZF64968.1 AbrB/MazE/SpoVT family DNA-binding domain-containing protein [Sphingomonas populi]